MSQISKLYGFCFRKILKKNWLRITLVTLALAVVWFAIPCFYFNVAKKEIARQVENKSGMFEHFDKLDDDSKRKILLVNLADKVQSFRGYNNFILEDSEPFKKFIRKLSEESIKKLEEAKKKGKSEKVLEEIKGVINNCEMHDKSKVIGLNFSYFTTDNTFFFCQTADYWEGGNGWKLLNNISWWNLTGFIALFYLVFSVLDNSFFDSKKDGEEMNILLFTPGVTRSDLLVSRILAFLTFYFLSNILLFLLPFGIIYFWVGTKTSMAVFSLLTLWTVIIGPILFFFLILAPYLLLKSWVRWLGLIIPSLVSFFPQFWETGKKLLYPLATWPYKVEEHFFNLSIFVPVSLIVGIVALVLFYWHYQEEDLGQSL